MATITRKIGMILPHRWQKVGYWLLGASALIIIAMLIGELFSGHTEAAAGVHLYDTVLGVLLPILANVTLFLLCLSSEKVEDEFVMHVRLGIIKRIACYWFIVSLIESLMFFFGARLLPLHSFSIMSLIFRPLTNIYILALVYFIWLKISLYRIRKEAGND